MLLVRSSGPSKLTYTILHTARHRRFIPSICALRHSYSTRSSESKGHGPRVAVVGSGPAGFYTARKLMREIDGTKIDMYERLPVPFGLVRFGVAPDHPEVKNCQDEFEEVASSPNYNFIGNVQLGIDLPLSILAKHYDALVFSYGASKDRKLGLDEEDKPNIYSARAFVGWYNGLPEYRDLNPDLTAGKTAIIMGQGNVALDVARTLLSNVEVLEKTDITNHAIEALSKSTIQHVHVVGRRGPVQAAFTIKEVRELLNLEGVNFTPMPQDLFPPDLEKLPRPKRRIMELLQKGRSHDPSATKSWTLDFLLTPKSLQMEDNATDKLAGVIFTKNTLVDATDPESKVTPTKEEQTIPTTTLFRSIGYKAEAIPGMDLIGATFDEGRGTMHHDGYGRILPMTSNEVLPNISNDDQGKLASLYCAGWVKRGPTGVIASTMNDAFETAEAIVADWRKVLSSADSGIAKKRGWEGVKTDTESEGHKLNPVHWDGWHAIDRSEKSTGAKVGKPREKMGTVKEMLVTAADA